MKSAFLVVQTGTHYYSVSGMDDDSYIVNKT